MNIFIYLFSLLFFYFIYFNVEIHPPVKTSHIFTVPSNDDDNNLLESDEN